MQISLLSGMVEVGFNVKIRIDLRLEGGEELTVGLCEGKNTWQKAQLDKSP